MRCVERSGDDCGGCGVCQQCGGVWGLLFGMRFVLRAGECHESCARPFKRDGAGRGDVDAAGVRGGGIQWWRHTPYLVDSIYPLLRANFGPGRRGRKCLYSMREMGGVVLANHYATFAKLRRCDGSDAISRVRPLPASPAPRLEEKKHTFAASYTAAAPICTMRVL